ncbi:S9 family peptidase [Sediminibacterium ginsengisoli]|uniref:Dipeptidyl-peptidase-4 n=1 Tax=Sediminibacterium ginsengisoli TaxID=413434 RepID=A0A1T4JY99_9BACT|nr:S9 family peptidase [Sediminibacterium ginsengisoli]SJZ35143.1 dipeptidyl-peptidase-4 [Sediminibacterium ginsengisoli]
MRTSRWLPVAIAAVAFVQGYGQKKEFSTADLLAGKLPKNLINPLPAIIKWVDDEHVILRQSIHPDSAAKNYVLDVKTGSMTETQEGGGGFGRGGGRGGFGGGTGTGKVIVFKDNDLFFIQNGTEKRLTNDKDEEKNATFSPDSNYVAYTKNNNLYTYNLAAGKETQLTTDGTATTLNGYASWVYFEEIFGRATRYRAFWWSPDSKKLAYMRFDESMVPMFPIYVNEGQHGYIEQTRYPKPGDKNPEVKVGIVNPDGGSTTWAAFNDKDDQYFGWPMWRPGTNALWVPWLNRDQNNLKMYEVNTSNGSKKMIFEETQKTWIDLDDKDRVTFLANGKQFIMQSDKTGWAHLYLYNNDGSLKNAITEGKYTVTGVKLIDEKNETIYFTARGKENTAHTDLYSVKFNGTGFKRLTFGDFNHAQTNLSPNAKYFITTYNNAATPSKMALVDNNGKLVKELGSAKGAEMDNYNMARTELVRIKSDDGLYELPALVTWPLNMDPNKKYPMLISVYGGPNAGNVWDSWTWSASRQFYASEGLIQVAFDHRASGHFGKEGVNYMHRNLGYWEMADYKAMAKWFIAKGQADPAKICITGFSYGGYMSCYALTYGSDVFTHAMAGGSVVDWSLYDSHYTEKFMGTPQNNPQGYKTSSVLSYIDQYKGMLQIVHGTSDDNVHMQNSMQLVSALEDKKKDFEFMLYPGGRHGWSGAKNDHFTNLKTKFVYKYLLEKPVPKALLR